MIYPLDVDVTAMWKPNTGSPKELLLFLGLVGVIILVVVFINRKNASGTVGKGGPGIFSGLAVHRMAKSIGLDREQIKMLDFVFKTDDVTDPEKSISTPALLDRHFRRAYRVIEQSASSEEEAQNKFSVLFAARNILENNVSGSLSSTRQLKEDMTLTIANGREKYNVSIVSTSGENLSVESPKNALGSLVKFPRGTKLSALAFTKNNKGFSFDTRVIGYSNTFGPSTLQLAHSNQLKLLSHRRFRRRQIVIACNMFLVYSEGSGKKQRLIVDKRRLTGSTTDVSVGGCSIKTKAPIQVGAKLKIEFTDRDGNVAALGQVLRTNRSGMVTVIHVKFLRVSRKSMNTINALVYEFIHE
jgi:hypothetical protein